MKTLKTILQLSIDHQFLHIQELERILNLPDLDKFNNKIFNVKFLNALNLRKDLLFSDNIILFNVISIESRKIQDCYVNSAISNKFTIYGEFLNNEKRIDIDKFKKLVIEEIESLKKSNESLQTEINELDNKMKQYLKVKEELETITNGFSWITKQYIEKSYRLKYQG